MEQPSALGDFVILHLFDFFHQNYGAMFGRKLRDRLVDSRSNFALLHPLVRQRIRFWHSLRCGIDFLQLDRIVELRTAALICFFRSQSIVTFITIR